MENIKKRNQHQEVENEQSTKQAKAEEENDDEEPAEEFLEPHLACEIYSALPAVHQRRLLTLCRDIYELGPSTDGWKRWMNFRWIANKWNSNDCGRGIDLSPDGLSIIRNDRVWQPNEKVNTVRAILPAFPMVTTNQPTQFCYFEAKFVRGFASIGFFGGDVDLHDSWVGPNKFGMLCTGDFPAGGFILPDTHWIGGDVIGCGMVKHLGGRRIFFTKNGEFIAYHAIPMDAPNQLFPAIMVNNCSGPRFEDTNFGLRPFLFKYKGNEEKLLKD